MSRPRRAVRVKRQKPKREKSTEPFDARVRALLLMKRERPEEFEKQAEHLKLLVENFERASR